MATIAEFSSGFPGISTRIPFENGFISEVLVERGYNTYCVGKWHLTPGEECNLAAYKGRWPLGRGFERFYGFLGGETNQWYPDLVHDNHPDRCRRRRRRRATTSSKDLADQAIGFIQRREGRSTPTSRSSCTSRPGAGTRRTTCSRSGPTSTRATFDEGYEAIRAGILARQKELGLLPDDTELSPINPHGEPGRTGPDGQPWPLLDTVRPWDSLSDDEQRLFARMAEVFAGFVSYTDDQLGRVLDYLEESGQLDNTIVVVVSDNGASGEGGPNGSFNEWRFFNGVADTTEPTLPHIDELGTPAVLQPLQHRLGVGVRHAVPVLEAVGRLRGRRRRHVPGRVAGADQAVGATSRQQYIHAVDVVPTIYDLLGIEPPDGASRATRRARSRARASRPRSPTRRRPGSETQFYAMLGQRSIYHDGWLACTAAPADLRLGQVRAGRVGALRPRARPLAVEERRRRTSPSGSRRSRACWFYYAGIYNGLPLDDRTALEQMLAERPQAAPDREQYIYYPRLSPTSPSRPASRSTAARTRSPRASRSTPPTPRACSTRTAASPAATASTSRTGSCATRSTGSAPKLYDIVADRDDRRRARTSSPPSSRRRARTTDPTMPGFARHADALRRRRAGRRAARSSPSPATSASSATASASGATAPRR